MKLNTQAYLCILAAAGATASPVPEVDERGIGGIINKVECLVVDVVVTALRACPTATEFCSSFLHIPTVTSSVTKTFTSPTTVTVTSTTGTNVITPMVTQTATATATVSTCSANHAAAKRDVRYCPKPSKVTKYADQEISKACSCLGIPTPTTTHTASTTLTPTATVVTKVAASVTTTTATTTTTVTSTTTVDSCPAPTLCSNQGLQFAYYFNDDGDNNDLYYSTFHPEEYKTTQPEYTGVTDTVGGIDIPGDSSFSIYGSPDEPTNYFVLNHRGYIYAQQTGTYTFSISDVDDSVYIWLGPLAYSGWLAANANAFVTIRAGESGSYSTDLAEGQYYPLRIIFAQAQGPASFNIQVTAPDGSTFLSSDSTASPYLVQYSCDGVTAPAYTPFGSET